MELARLREATVPVYLTRRRNPNSLTLVQDREKAEKMRILERLAAAGAAGSKVVHWPLNSATPEHAPHASTQQRMDEVGEEERKGEDGNGEPMLAVLYHQAEGQSRGSMGMGRKGSSWTRLLCSCSYLQLTSSYEASLEVAWQVGVFFTQTVQQPGEALRGRIGRVLDVVPHVDASRRGHAHSIRCCLRVLWYRAVDVEMEEERGLHEPSASASQSQSHTGKVYRCHAIDLVTIHTPLTRSCWPDRSLSSSSPAVCRCATAQTDQAPAAVSPWEVNSASLGLPTRFPYMAQAQTAPARRSAQQRLPALLVDPPPPLPSVSAHAGVEEWEQAQISLCLHRLHCDLIGHLHLPSQGQRKGEEDAGDAAVVSAVIAPLLAFRQSFVELASQHCERLVSGWEELQLRLQDDCRALLLHAATAGRAQLMAVASAIDCTVRRVMRSVRKEAGAEHGEGEEEELCFDSLQHLRRHWKKAGGQEVP